MLTFELKALIELSTKYQNGTPSRGYLSEIGVILVEFKSHKKYQHLALYIAIYQVSENVVSYESLPLFVSESYLKSLTLF